MPPPPLARSIIILVEAPSIFGALNGRSRHDSTRERNGANPFLPSFLPLSLSLSLPRPQIIPVLPRLPFWASHSDWEDDMTEIRVFRGGERRGERHLLRRRRRRGRRRPRPRPSSSARIVMKRNGADALKSSPSFILPVRTLFPSSLRLSCSRFADERTGAGGRGRGRARNL